MTLIKIDSDCCGNIIYEAEASSTGISYTYTGDKVTSTSTATATSTKSYEDAYKIALKIAKDVARSNAENDANVINESLQISNVTNDFSKFAFNNYFNNLNSLNNFKLPTPKKNDPQFYNIITNIPNFEGLAKGLNNGITTFVFDKDYSNLYIGGYFINAYQKDSSQITVNYIVRWNIAEQTWYPLGNNGYCGLNNSVSKILFDKDFSNLYVGGFYFTEAYQSDGSIISVNKIARWNIAEQKWYPLGINLNIANGLNDGYIAALTFDEDFSNLYVGGNFIYVNQSDGTKITVNRIAKWNIFEQKWYSLGTNDNSNGLNNTVNTFVFDKDYSNLYVGGDFTYAYQSDGTKILAANIAKWNINEMWWYPLGSVDNNGLSGYTGAVVDILVFDKDYLNLYVGGDFNFANQNDNQILNINY